MKKNYAGPNNNNLPLNFFFRLNWTRLSQEARDRIKQNQCQGPAGYICTYEADCALKNTAKVKET